jgi:Fe-Mn family superoxide dismutase
MVDFGTKRAPYVEAFMENINWAVVEQRLENMLWHANKKK